MSVSINNIASRSRVRPSGPDELEYERRASGDVDARAAALAPAPGMKGRQSAPASAWQSPPRPEQPFQRAALAGALESIGTPFSPLDPNGQHIQLPGMAGVPPEFMVAYIGILSMTSALGRAEIKLGQSQRRTEQENELRIARAEALHLQLGKAIQEMQASEVRTATDRTMELMWATASIACGVLKMALGAPGGLIDIAAGAAGVLKVGCEMAAEYFESKEDHQFAAALFRGGANVCDWIQIGAETASMATDALSFVRTFGAVRAVGKATKVVLEGGEKLGATLANDLSKAGSVSKKVAKEVAAQVAPQIEKMWGKQAVNFMGHEILEKTFSAQAIETIVERSIKRVCKKAAKSGAKVSSNELVSHIVTDVYKKCALAAAKVTTRGTPNVLKNGAYAVLNGGNLIGRGINNQERSTLRKEIQDLLNDASFMQSVLDEFGRIKKQLHSEGRDQMDAAGMMLESSLQSLQNCSDNQLRVIGRMGGGT